MPPCFFVGLLYRADEGSRVKAQDEFMMHTVCLDQLHRSAKAVEYFGLDSVKEGWEQSRQ